MMSNEINFEISVCPRCNVKFKRYSKNDIYCSEECEFEFPFATPKKLRKKPVVSIERITQMLEDYRKKTGEKINYGRFVYLWENKKLPKKI